MDQASGGQTNLSNVFFILVRPQLGDNIGAVARAMLNFGFENLRIVEPRDGWPNQKALEVSVGAKILLERAQVFSNIDEAIADLNYIYGTTARERDLNKKTCSARNIALEIESSKAGNIGILFGPENFGLSNLDLTYCNKILYIDVNKDFSSLNISHAAAVIAYELSKINIPTLKERREEDLASADEINHLFNHLEHELEKRGFFTNVQIKETMVKNIRSIFKRIDNFTSQDVRTFRGIIKSLTGNGNL